MSAYAYREDYITTRDGERLLTRTVFPLGYRAGEKRPCVVHRTPYEEPVSRYPFDPTTLGRVFTDFLDRGYVFVNQHCRGTGSSSGEFRNMSSEREDGLDTLDWVREQGWYNGEIFLYGNSYKSYVASVLIGLNPPDVKGAALAVMPADQALCCYEKNTFKHDLFTLWFSKTFRKNQLEVAEINRRMREELPKRPVATLAKRVYGEEVPELTGCFTHGPGDEFWRNPDTDLGHCYAAPYETKIPLLLVGGLWDIHYAGLVEYWRTLAPELKAKSAALIGPWTHSMATLQEHKPLFPGSNHPPVEAEWFDHIRTGSPLNFVSEGMMSYYRPGEGWRREAEPWTEPGETVSFVLSGERWPGGAGAAAGGDGGAVTAGQAVGAGSAGTAYVMEPCDKAAALPVQGAGAAAEDGTALGYIFDPSDPLTLPGGASVFQTSLRGPQPQPEPGFRQDLLSFVSAPLKAPAMLDGCVHMSLDVMTDCDDTAFFVRVDLVRGGNSLCLRDTIVNLCDLVPAYKAGERVRLNFDLDPVVFGLKKGDALRVDVSSSDYPCYAVHSNTREPWYSAVETRVAHNTVYAGTSYATFELG